MSKALKKTQVSHEIKILTRIYKPDVMFLLETMVDEKMY